MVLRGFLNQLPALLSAVLPVWSVQGGYFHLDTQVVHRTKLSHLFGRELGILVPLSPLQVAKPPLGQALSSDRATWKV